jgi:predicted metal-dependent phosphoesterase TrpH
MAFLKYDLHTHTTASDGSLSPIELFELADKHNIKNLAITDHDTVAGVRYLLDLQQKKLLNAEIKIIAGAEFTCLLNNQILHVVALNVDLNNDLLNEHVLKLHELRIERAEKISQKLQKCKLPDLMPYVLAKVKDGQIGRPHFAKVLCDLGVVANEAAAFKKYLGAGKSANVKVQWPELEEVLAVISGAGGVAVLAHPTKYKLTMSKLRKIIATFAELGGEAIEISYPGVTLEQQKILKYEADKHALSVSAGSDFHTPDNSWIELGRYPDLPSDLPHVLSKLSDVAA